MTQSRILETFAALRKKEPIATQWVPVWRGRRGLNPRPHGPEVLSKIPLDPFGPA